MQDTEAQATHRFHFGQTRNNKKRCAHLGHTAGYRNTSNPLVPFRSDSQQQEMLCTPRAHCKIQKHKQLIGSISVRLATTGIVAHTWGTLQDTEAQATHWVHSGQTRNNKNCCAHLGHTAGYRSTSNPLGPFRSDSQQQELLRTPRAHCKIQRHKQPIGSISVRLATTGTVAHT